MSFTRRPEPTKILFYFSRHTHTQFNVPQLLTTINFDKQARNVFFDVNAVKILQVFGDSFLIVQKSGCL